MGRQFTINLGEQEINTVLNALLALHDLQKEEYKAECNSLYNKIKIQTMLQEKYEN